MGAKKKVAKAFKRYLSLAEKATEATKNLSALHATLGDPMVVKEKICKMIDAIERLKNGHPVDSSIINLAISCQKDRVSAFSEALGEKHPQTKKEWKLLNKLRKIRKKLL